MYHDFLSTEFDYRNAGRHRNVRRGLIEGLRSRKKAMLTASFFALFPFGLTALVFIIQLVSTMTAKEETSQTLVLCLSGGTAVLTLIVLVTVLLERSALDKEIKMLLLIDELVLRFQEGNSRHERETPDSQAAFSK